MGLCGGEPETLQSSGISLSLPMKFLTSPQRLHTTDEKPTVPRVELTAPSKTEMHAGVTGIPACTWIPSMHQDSQQQQ